MTFLFKMILNEDFFDDINTEDIVNIESNDIENTYQHSVYITYKLNISELVDENYKQGSDLVNEFNKIYRRINMLFNNAPFIFDYKINICTYPINKCNAVRKFGPYDIHYNVNDSKSDVRMTINIMFDSGYTTLSNIVNFFLQLFKSRIRRSDFLTQQITIKDSKHYNYRDYSLYISTFMQRIGYDLELADFEHINSNIKFLSEEFCKPGSYSKYINKIGIINGRYLIDNIFRNSTGVSYIHIEGAYIDAAPDDINIDNYYYGLYNPINGNSFSAELGHGERVCTKFDLENTDPIKIENKLKEFFREPHPAYLYTFKSSASKPYVLYCFNETLIIDDIEYVVFIYDSCHKTDDEYKKANYIKLITPYYEGNDKYALDYYKVVFNVEMTRDEYDKILSILKDKTYYETKS